MATDRAAVAPTLPCACASLRRAARAVTQLYDEALRATGLRVTQFTLLQVLQRRGEVTQAEIGDFLALDSTTLSRTLRPLETKNWIRSRPGEDRRERYWSITATGLRKLESALPAWETRQSKLRKHFGDTRWQGVLADLAAITASARAI
jgi:DNA-binding MarR family transcriptional regulator